MIIIDESSEYKSHKTNRFKELTRILKDQRIYLLSGTPTPQGYLDLWSQMYILDRGKRLGANFYHYRNKYFFNFKKYRWALQAGAKKAIKEIVKDITVFSEGEIILPPLKIFPIYLKFSPEKQITFNNFKEQFVWEWEEEEVTALSTAVMINKCLQLSNGMIYQSDEEALHFDDTKLNWLIDFNNSTDENIAVFYLYKFDKERILKIKGARAIETVKDVDDWNAGKIKLGVLSSRSMKFGGNMQYGGHVIIWFGLTWDLLQFLQANKRIYRLGQEFITRIYYLMMDNTYDKYVYQTLITKTITQEDFLEAIKLKREEK